MSGRVYGKEVFSPRYVSIQILTLVTAFYALFSTTLLSLSLLFTFAVPRFRHPFQHIFYDPSELMFGLWNVAALLFTALSVSWIVKLIVERSRKVLDFVFTVYLFHFILTWIIGGFPSSLAWWIAHGVAITITTVTSEILCRREESAEIVLATAKE